MGRKICKMQDILSALKDTESRASGEKEPPATHQAGRQALKAEKAKFWLGKIYSAFSDKNSLSTGLI